MSFKTLNEFKTRSLRVLNSLRIRSRVHTLFILSEFKGEGLEFSQFKTLSKLKTFSEFKTRSLRIRRGLKFTQGLELI